ncbi:MAG TPA: hypothetical protein VFM25_04095 [Verrucomicrobiae bacterium]|nr:hypothetical protein [Verrucomicrobiae bacterium]
MNANYKRIPTRFGPDTRFEVKPVPPATFRATQENELERFKNRLLKERLDELTEPSFNAYLRRAANEAAAIAWATPYPLLVLPVLFEEKAETAVLQAKRQAGIRERSRELLVV